MLDMSSRSHTGRGCMKGPSWAHLSNNPAGWAAAVAAGGKPAPAMQIIAAARTHAGRGTMAELARLVEDPSPLLDGPSGRRRSRLARCKS